MLVSPEKYIPERSSIQETIITEGHKPLFHYNYIWYCITNSLNSYTLHITPYDLFFTGVIFTGLNFALLLWFTKKANQPANRFLALAMAVAALWIIRVVGIDIQVGKYFPHWSWLPLQFSLALGPLMYFYSLKITQPEYRFGRKDLLHFGPLLPELGIQILAVRESAGTGIATYDTPVFHLLNPAIQVLAFISVISYLYMSRKLVARFYREQKFNYLGDRYLHQLRWLHRLQTWFGLAWLLWIPYTAADYLYFHHQLGLPAYYPLYTGLAIMITWLAAETHLRPEAITPLEASPSSSPTIMRELKQKSAWLSNAMKAGGYYRDPELSLGSLAEKLDTPTRELSRVINTGLKKNFNDFVNEYRVNDVKQRMCDPAFDRLTLLGIAYDSGFNSKATFNRTFREITGKSAAEYKAELKKGRSNRDLSPYLSSSAIISYNDTTPLWSHQKLNRNYMIRNYLKVAWRNLARNKVSAMINIGGLAVGMSVAMLIGLWIWDELSFNKYHQNYDHIAQVRSRLVYRGEVGINSSVQYPLATELKTNYKDNFKHIVMASWDVDNILSAGEKKLSRTGLFMDPDAPEMLTLKMIHGSRGGLKDVHSIMLSASTAKAFFGDKDPVNKAMKINNKLNVTVTGVYEDLPLNTQFKDLKFLAPTALWILDNPWIGGKTMTDWNNHFLKIYVEINPNTDFDKVNARIKNAELKNLGNFKEQAQMHPQVFLLPMRDWHLHNYKRGNPDTGPLQMLWLIGIIGAFVLLLACINFMNLSTARSEKRAKEIGVRKAVGSLRRQLVGQFYSESFLVVVLSFALSLFLVWLFLSPFNEISAKEVSIPLGSGWFWLASILFVLLTSIIAGSYPALYLSSFNAVKVLKGTFSVGRFASLPRKILVVTQFTVSVALIICTIIIYRQVQVAKDRPVGYTREGVVMIEKKSADFDGKYDLLRTELKKTGVVSEMSESFGKVTEIGSGNGGFKWRGKDPKLEDQFGTLPVSFEYGKTIGWQFVQGRDFSRDFLTDSSGIVINESAAKYMGLKSPVGEAVSWKFQDQPVKYYKILGVVKDMIMESPYEPMYPTIFMIKGHVGTTLINVKINPKVSASKALLKIADVFKKIIPSAPFEYKFADEEYNAKFAAEQRIGTLAAVFAALAIFISCLGLFGLASFVAEQRTKEIGIRKVLGASVYNLWGMLSANFVQLVVLSQLIASPIAWYFMHQWLQRYHYRTDISWWIFAVTWAGAIVITLVTVSFQAINAALANPVRSLRSE